MAVLLPVTEFHIYKDSLLLLLLTNAAKMFQWLPDISIIVFRLMTLLRQGHVGNSHRPYCQL